MDKTDNKPDPSTEELLGNTAPPTDALQLLRKTINETRAQSQQILAEATAILQRSQQLHAPQQLLEVAFPSFSRPDGYVITDPNGIIHEVNSAAHLLLEVHTTHLIGKPLINFIALEDRQVLRRDLLQLRSLKQKPDVPITEFVQITARKGKPFECSLRIRGIYDPATGELERVQWLLRDLSDRYWAETERYRLLVDAVEEYAVFLLDSDGYINSWNRGAENTFGYSEIEALGLPFSTLFPDAETAADRSQQELDIARREGRVPEEHRYLRKNGEQFFGQGVLIALPGGGDTGRTGFAKITRDVTEQLRQQEEVKLREVRLQVALQAAGAATWDWNLDTQEVSWQEDYWQLIGMDRSYPASYETWKESVHPDDKEQADKVVSEAIRTGGPIISEYRIANPGDTGERWLLTLGQTIKDASGHDYRATGITMDITERKQVETRLEARVAERTKELEQANAQLQVEIAERERIELARRDLMRRLASAREEERRRISRELHDQMGQHLTAFALGLRTLEDRQEHDSENTTLLKRLRGIAEEMGKDIHRLAVELRPTSLDDLGLVSSLRGYILEWSERVGITADLVDIGMDSLRLSSATETAIYRIIQEALTNVARHAIPNGATHVAVTIQHREDTVLVIVEDDGPGFDTQAAERSGRLGLAGMRERAELAGGSLEIESSNEGTAIYLRLSI